MELAYGEGSAAAREGRVAVVQSLSGTGSCRLFAEFQARFLPGSRVYIPSPTWSNHHSIWKDARVEETVYPYYKPETKGLDFEGMLATFDAAPAGSAVLLHACAHNPTGVDPTPGQWRELSALMLKRRLFPFFDMVRSRARCSPSRLSCLPSCLPAMPPWLPPRADGAATVAEQEQREAEALVVAPLQPRLCPCPVFLQAYQGFASGSCEADAAAIRTFIEGGHRLGLSQSYAKNMGLYGQRVGAFSIVCDSADEARRVESQMKLVARPMCVGWGCCACRGV